MFYYIIFTAAIFYFLNRVFNIKNLFNPLVFIILLHFVFFYIGLFYRDIYHHIKISALTVFLINYSIITILIGGILSRFIFQKIDKSYVRFLQLDIHLNFYSKTSVVGIIFILLGTLLTIYYIVKSGGIVLFADDAENSRILARKGSGLIVQLAINFFTYGLLTVIMIRGVLLLKIVSVIFVFFLVLTYGNRGPALYLLVFMIYIIQAAYNKEFSMKKIMIFGLGLFSLMVLFGSLRTNYQADLIELFKARFAWRPFVNIQNFQLVLDYFPNKHEFLLGTTYIQDISMLLPGSHPNSGTYLKELMGLKFDGGSITPSYLGISYVNFGYFGLVFSPLILGFIANTFYEVYIRNMNMKKPANVILLILVSFNFAAIISSGVMTVVIQNMTIIFLIHVFYVGLIGVLERTRMK